MAAKQVPPLRVSVELEVMAIKRYFPFLDLQKEISLPDGF